MNSTHRGQEHAGQPGRGWEDSGLPPTLLTCTRGAPCHVGNLCVQRSGNLAWGCTRSSRNTRASWDYPPPPVPLLLGPPKFMHSFAWGAWVPVEELRPGVGGGLSPSTDQDEWAGTRCPPPALRRGVRGRARGGRCRHVGLPTAGACTGVSLCVLSCTRMQALWHTDAVCERTRVQGSAHMCLCVNVSFYLSNECLHRAGQAAWVGSAYTGEDVQVAFCVSVSRTVCKCTLLCLCARINACA